MAVDLVIDIENAPGALAQIAAAISDAGVSALMLHAACESAALNVRINLNSLADSDFVGWKTDEVASLLSTSRMMLDEIQAIVEEKMKGD